MRRAIRCAGAPLLVAVLSATALGQRVPDGFFRVENAEHGYRFHCPRTFKEMPIPPGDEVLVGRFVRKTPIPTTRSERARRPMSGSDTEIWILAIDRPRARPDADAGTPPEFDPGTAPPGPEAPPGERPEDPSPTPTGPTQEASKPEPKSHEEILAERLAASSFEEFVKKRLRGWEIVSTETDESRDRSWTEYRLERARKQRDGSVVAVEEGVAWMFEHEDRILGLFASAPTDDFRKRWKSFATGATSLEPIEVKFDVEELERHYARHPEYKDPAFRIERRKGLARGWKAIDTENYLILHHTRDTKLLDRIENDIEAVRAFYERLFPPTKPIEAVSVVRVCKDRKEYIDYGGNPGSAGYWNFVLGELVLFDNVAGRQGSRFGNRDSYIVLYHEAFHQYIHYSAGEIAPHIWFNEGYADYFSGTIVYARSDKIKEIDTHPWRTGTIRKAVAEGKHVPFEKFLEAEKAEYYRQGALYYAQGWSLIYFLNESRAAADRPEWQRITPVYFETLKAAYQEELEKLGPDPNLPARTEAQKKARDRALAAAFEEVDVAELEAEWRQYVERYVR